MPDARPRRNDLTPVPYEQRCLLRQYEVAAWCGVSKSAASKWHQQRLIPAPVWVGGQMFWRVAEVRDWIAAGCPEREEWRWEPTELVTVSELLQRKKRELAVVVEQMERVDRR
jgi:predicted DNA-binding transcriptional regulator AlpA